MDLSGGSATSSFIHQDSGDHNEENEVAVLVRFVRGARAAPGRGWGTLGRQHEGDCHPTGGRLHADGLGRNQRGREMNNELTAVVKQDGAWWIGWIEEASGVNCQEATRDALIESLRVTLREALDLNREDALAAAGDLYSEEKIGARNGAN